jgi:lambda family phage minor tail protein L
MADEGKNLVARNLLDLEPTAVLEFFQLQLDPSNAPDGFPQVIPFHAGTVFKGNVIWQGTKYIPIAVETEGFEMLGDRRLPRPRIRVANNNQLITYLLQNNKDLVNAKVVRKKTFLKNLDDANFDGGNPWGQANANAEIIDEVWIIGRKSHESKIMVEFELNSPLDLESFSVNSRSVISKYCGWQYRGEGCRYQGIPIERENGKSFLDRDGETVTVILPEGGESFYSSPDSRWNEEKTYSRGEVVWISNNRIKIASLEEGSDVNSPLEPVKTCFVCVSGNQGQRPELNPSYWQKDGCTKQLSACRKRFNLENKVRYLQSSTYISDSFNVIELSGNKNLTSDATQAAGAFYSLENTGNQPDLTGVLTGTFTLAGWVKDNDSSSSLSAIWSTTPQHLEIGPEGLGVVDGEEVLTPEARQWASGDTAQFLNWGRDAPYYIYPSQVDPQPSQVGGWTPPNSDDQLKLYQYVSMNDGVSTNPIDGSGPLYNVRSQFDLAGKVNDEWKFFVITHLGPETPDYQDGPNNAGEEFDTQLKMWLNPTEENSPDLLNQDDPSVPKFANLSGRKAPNKPAGGFAGLPEQFMLGSIISGSVHPTMNGQLGPWALWKRQLTPAERKFLYKPFINPNDKTHTISYIPRPYSECNEANNRQAIVDEDLLAWWDMSTGEIKSTADFTVGTYLTGLVDIHSGLYWLTGSGYFTPKTENYTHVEYDDKMNFSSPYPRYGGFPGTDGYTFGG